MKKFFKVLLVIIIIIVAVVGVFALYVSQRSIPKYAPPKKIEAKVEITPERVAQGQKLATMLCHSCHYNENTDEFTGRELTDIPQFGKIYSANITHDSIVGIGNWSDGDLIYFIRTGIKPDGQYVPPYMPKLIHISDEDLKSIIAFLRSDNNWVKANTTHMPKSDPSFLSKFLVTIGAMKPFEYPGHALPGPDTTNKVEWGKYITLYQLECYTCHSQSFAKNDYYEPEKSPGFFGGGNEMYDLNGNKIYSLNITQDKSTGIGNWSEADFIKAVKTGILPNNQPALRNPMQPYANLSDEEVSAIYAFLKTVPPINNKVERKF